MSNLCPLSVTNPLHDRIILSLGNAFIYSIPIIAINASIARYFQASPDSALFFTVTTLLMRSVIPIVDHQISQSEQKAHSYVHGLARSAFYLSMNIFLSNQLSSHGAPTSFIEVVGYTFATSAFEKGFKLIF